METEMYRRQNNEYQPRTTRVAIVDGYSQLISTYVNQGLEAHYLNFMFHPLPGGAKTQKEIMAAEVTRVHGILTLQIVRKDKSEAWKHLRPVFIGSPDLPVHKDERVSSRLHRPNGGLHFNVIALVPPKNPLPKGMDQHPLMLKQSRLHVSSADHFEEKRDRYQNGRLYRIEVTRIASGTMADYTLKAFKLGNVSSNDILILT
jgi:hypothetical protein